MTDDKNTTAEEIVEDVETTEPFESNTMDMGLGNFEMDSAGFLPTEDDFADALGF